MQIKNVRGLAIGTIVFSLVNIWWVYLYTWTGIKFSDVFDPQIAFRFTGPDAITLILLLFAIGFMISLSIFLARVFSMRLNKLEKTVMVAVGVALPIVACLSFFTNILVFVIMMLFYLLGCLFMVNSKREDGKPWSKMKSSYHASKNVVTFLAIGALVASLLFVSMNLEDSKAKFKDAMLGFQSGLNVSSFISKEDIRQMLINQTASMSNMTTDQILANPVIMAQIEASVDPAYEKIKNASAMPVGSIMEKMFQNPPFSYLFDFLPILIAVLVASMVSFFGSIWISPMSGALGAFMPNPPNAPEPPKEPPMAKK